MTSSLILPDVTLTTPNSFSSGTTIVAADVNTDFTAVETAITAVNTNFTSIETWADAIPDGDLASPNNSVYKTLLNGMAYIPGSTTAATYFLTPDGTIVADTVAAGKPISFYFASADYAVAGLTTYLRVRMQVYCNNTNAVATFTGGLRTFTNTGTAGNINFTFGALVGSAASIAAPLAQSQNTAVTADLAIPSDGHYGLALGVTGTVAANNISIARIQLQTRNAT